jgi:hypothetical protein
MSVSRLVVPSSRTVELTRIRPRPTAISRLWPVRTALEFSTEYIRE